MAGDRWAALPSSARVLRLALVSSLVLPIVAITVIVMSVVHGRWVLVAFGLVLLASAVWVRSKTWPVWRRQLREARERESADG